MRKFPRMRAVVAGVAMTLAATGLAACAGGGSDDGDKVTLRFGHPYPADSVIGKGVEQFAQEVADETDGRVEVKVFPAGQLGSEIEMNQALSEGTLDLRLGSLPTEKMPQLQVVLSPYLFDSADGMVSTMRSELATELLWQPMNDELGFQWLDSWYYGTFQLTSNKEFTDPESMKGASIRTPEADSFIDMIEAMGGTAEGMPYTEVYTALQTGVIDGQFNPHWLNYASKIGEVQKYIVPADMITGTTTLYTSDKTMTKLGDDADIVRRIAQKVGDDVKGDLDAADQDALKELEASGLKVLSPDIDAFRAAIEKNYLPKYDPIFGTGVYKKLQDAASAG